ncbi:MAG: GNAT family N-acetyltransferase [Betaproteobacteria bacterium]
MARLVEVTDPADIAAVRELFGEYAREVDEPRCFAGFTRELAGLPGEYARPHGRLLLAREGAAAAGCVGLRRLSADAAEIKRLYVRPAYRGTRLGRRLAEAAIDAARAGGCRRVMLDTLPKMREAIALYRSLGFRETGPYLAEPTPGSICFELVLSAAPEGARPARSGA